MILICWMEIGVYSKTTKTQEMPKDSPLCNAVTNDHIGKVKLLLTEPNLDVNWCTSKGKTALSLACRNKNKYIVTLLFRHPRININFKKSGCKTAFTVAVETNDSELIQMFLKDSRFDKHQHLKYLACNSHDSGPLLFKLLFAYELMDYVYFSPRINFIYNKTVYEFYEQRSDNRQKVISLNQAEFRVKQTLAAELHTLVVCVADDYFRLNHINVNDHTHRFFCMTTILPMELQMLICNRFAGSTNNNIPSIDFNYALKCTLL